MRRRGWSRQVCSRILALYPAAWRERYGAELAEMIERHEVTAATILDLAVSAVDAHRHPDVVPTQARRPARTQSGLVSILIATIVFIAGWALVINVMLDGGGAWIRSDHQGADLAVKFVGLAGAAGIFAIMAGCVVLIASVDPDRASGRRSLVRPAGLALIGLVAFVGLFAAAEAAIQSDHSSALWRPAILGWVVAVAVVGRAVAKASPDAKVLGSSTRLVRLGVVSLALSAAGSVWVGAAVSVEVPAVDAPLLPIIMMAGAATWVSAVFHAARRTSQDTSGQGRSMV
jgi:hypothetical protein